MHERSPPHFLFGLRTLKSWAFDTAGAEEMSRAITLRCPWTDTALSLFKCWSFSYLESKYTCRNCNAVLLNKNHAFSSSSSSPCPGSLPVVQHGGWKSPSWWFFLQNIVSTWPLWPFLIHRWVHLSLKTPLVFTAGVKLIICLYFFFSAQIPETFFIAETKHSSFWMGRSGWAKMSRPFHKQPITCCLSRTQRIVTQSCTTFSIKGRPTHHGDRDVQN